MQSNLGKTILVVDDKAGVRQLLMEYLTGQGFHVVAAADGREALFTARHEHPDLILLDIMMPEMDGYSFIRTYRAESEVPIILLTARLDDTDKVIGLELGADDYVTKPFNMAELVARIRAVMRRAYGTAVEQDMLRIGGITLSKKQRSVMVGDEPVDLTPTEFDLLTLLMEAPGQVFSRSDLLDHLTGEGSDRVERTIDVHVRNLRAKIEPDPREPRYIETVFGVGYRFAAS